MPKERIYRFVNNSRLIQSVDAFLQFQRSPVFGIIKSAKEFLNEKDESGKTNFQRIQDFIVDSDVQNKNFQLFDKGKYGEIFLPYAVELVATKSKIQILNYAFQGINLVRQPEAWFKADKLVELENNKEYIRSAAIIKNDKLEGKLVQQMSQVSVWIWSRALNKVTKLVDVSPYLYSCTISNTLNGGNFQMKLAPVTYSTINNEIQVDKDSVINFFDSSLVRTSLISINNENKFQRSKFLFKDLFQQNDLVFIKYERLELEKKRKQGFENMLIDSSELPGEVYDMIGLVDTSSETSSAEDGAVSIDIQGRDLMKMFIDDGTYFFPYEVSKGSEYIAGGGKENVLSNRMFGGLLPLYRQELSIVDIFQFVIYQLSNILICPDKLLSYYKDSGIDKFSFSLPQQEDIDSEIARNYKEKILNKGIWKLFNIVTDENIDQRLVVDSSLSTATGSLLNFLQAVCQKEFVQFYSDTYGDSYYFILRKPPFDRKAYESLLNGLVKTKNELRGDSTNKIQTNYELKSSLIIDIDSSIVLSDQITDETECYSWYHLTPRQNILGAAYNRVFIPPIYFPEYAEIWGSKSYEVQHNYVPFSTKITSDSGLILNALEGQSLLDLKFLIETTCYLPFTRKGRITIIGDRRIKVGNFIRYLLTGEIFYVEAVTQGITISDDKMTRTTTLVVSRGMVEKHIIDSKYSYFKIINLSSDVKFIKRKVPIIRTETVVVNQAEIDEFYKKENVKSSTSASSFNYPSPFPFLNPFIVRPLPLQEALTVGADRASQTVNAMIHKWEGKSPGQPWTTPYKDGVTKKGVQLYTTGWGHQVQPTEQYLITKTITVQEADVLLSQDLVTFSKIVSKQAKLLGLNLSQNQFDALVDFVYGTGNLSTYRSFTLAIKKFLSGEITENTLISKWASTSITQMGNPTPLKGLINRRKEEVALFLGKNIDYIQTAYSTNGIPEPIYSTKEVNAGFTEISEIDRDDFNKNFVVNKEVFNFFLLRKQFLKTDEKTTIDTSAL